MRDLKGADECCSWDLSIGSICPFSSARYAPHYALVGRIQVSVIDLGSDLCT